MQERIFKLVRDAKNQNLVRSVHLDVGCDPKDPVGETRWLQAIADRCGFPHGIVGYADFQLMWPTFWTDTCSSRTSAACGNR